MSNQSSRDASSSTVPIVAVKESLVTVDIRGHILMKNEMGSILLGDQRLKAEVLRVQSGLADLQVFEDTRGVRVGDRVELTGELLSAQLGPGLLGTVFDGLQNPLETLAKQYGFFLPRGKHVEALDPDKQWEFSPSVVPGEQVLAGQVLGEVPEGPLAHRIMAPFDEKQPMTVAWLRDGVCGVNDSVARLVREDGSEVVVKLSQRFPVRRPIPARMLRNRSAVRLLPNRPIQTGQRVIDTFFPIAQGGTACIPGPFGAGKTVLQSLIARYSDVDVVVIIACGERAGEVVETIKEYPRTEDPRTGGSLMDRTIIVCNTSSMPVAAREASIYMGMTLGEYYRQMGYNVLCIADSTSRWAQAMRETSGRMEEIPGEEAFPAYLDSSIKELYERAGVIQGPKGVTGSLTLVGTVSPAGGNFEEPVTQATLATVKTFLGLSSERAYRRYYPAIDPLISWSRYLDQMPVWFAENLDKNWSSWVKSMTQLLHQGDSIYQMMQVTGEEGISLQDYVTWQKATLVDMVYLQQDAFDKTDAANTRQRQLESFKLLWQLVDAEYSFEDKTAAQQFFTQVTSLYKNYNYSQMGSEKATSYVGQIQELLSSAQRSPESLRDREAKVATSPGSELSGL